MTVEEMIEYSARAIFDAAEWRSDANAWESLSGPEQSEWEDAAYEGLESLGIPLETLAALKAGTWKAVPVDPTDGMLDELDILVTDVLVDGRPSADEMAAAWSATLAAAPAKPEERGDK